VPRDDGLRLTVGSLLGMPVGVVREQPAPSSSPATSTTSTSSTVDEIEGPNWVVTAGEVQRDTPTAWRSDAVEALTFNNPFGQVMERVWFDGKVVYAVDLGAVVVDPTQVKVAQEYQLVYAIELDEQGRHVGEPDRVAAQLNIYDTVPGMARYSPIWQFNYVIVPRDYVPNTLRSEGDCFSSGYPILKSQDFEN
jgi:hypothetical protein